MEKFIEDFVNDVQPLLEYESQKKGFSVTSSLVTKVKTKLKEKMENSDMLWSVVPFGDAAYSIADDLFTESLLESI